MNGTDQNLEPVRMGLSEQDKADLLAFLHTFTDQNLITDPKFSNPFEEK